MKTIGITGGTGTVGTKLAALLIAKGYKVIFFTRTPEGKVRSPGSTYALWDAALGRCDVGALKQIKAMVHLAGEPIAEKRLTAAQKKKIVDSRVEGTRFLVSQLKDHGASCKVLVAASATGFYGDDADGNPPFTESMLPATDFLGTTCKLWELESQKAAEAMRTTILRIGIVLDKNKGAFPEFVKPTAFGMKPILGSGNQIISWIHVDDLARLIVHSVEQPSMHGIYNAVSPQPVSNKQMMDTIADVKGGFLIPVLAPSFMLKIAIGELSSEVLKSCTVSSEKTLESGFAFGFPEIRKAVKNLLEK